MDRGRSDKPGSSENTLNTTGEIDFLMPKREDVIERLEALGFEQSLPRHWVFDQTIAFEAPGAQLDDGDEAEPIKLASGRTVLIKEAAEQLGETPPTIEES
jgi:hypothetical protein